MKHTVIYIAIFTLIVVLNQASALQQEGLNSELTVQHKSSVTSCDLKDVGEKVEQLITKGFYTLANVVISLEGATYDSVECVKTGFLEFWRCLGHTWAAEYHSLVSSVVSYCSLASQLVADIARDLLICVHL